MKNKKGIIFAADIPEKSKLIETVKAVGPYVEAIKIGNLVLYEHSWKIVKEIKHVADLPVIADLKLMDIPDIAERTAEAAVAAGTDGIMVCGAAGSDAIAACMKFNDYMVFVFTEFTHCGGLISKEMANDYIDMALTLGCAGIQVPGTKEDRIKEVREKVGRNLIIISCGVGSQNQCSRRGVKTKCGTAVAAGADYEIIGRSIYSPTELGRNAGEAAMRARERIWEALAHG